MRDEGFGVRPKIRRCGRHCGASIAGGCKTRTAAVRDRRIPLPRRHHSAKLLPCLARLSGGSREKALFARLILETVCPTNQKTATHRQSMSTANDNGSTVYRGVGDTSPGPSFKSRLLHIKTRGGPEQGVVGKILLAAFRKALLGLYENTPWCGENELRKSAQGV